MGSDRQFGIFAAMTTPFDEGGAIDLRKLVAHARTCIAGGCAGISTFGTTGEGPSVATAERRPVLEALRSGGIDGHQVVPGIAVSAVDDAAALAREAAEFGCRALLVTPPIFYKNVLPGEVTEWFAALLERTPADGPPLILYNIPQMTGVKVTRETVAALTTRYPGRILGLKDSSGDWANALEMLQSFPDLDILIGDERVLDRGVQLGAAGAISGVANFRADLLNEVMAGKPASPALAPLVEAIVAHPATPAVKALVGHLSGDGGWRRVRPPLIALTETEAQQLGRRYDELFARDQT
ncbi:MAG TPA: dihydrodipicolinate synthase family protein [Devosiaceae bacterium]|jgi:4-hydroxy-tetrahydrodipicolinate synthase|nr:dihydrodipicolinate synthase family protein [Devosiaceae bacterium]